MSEKSQSKGVLNAPLWLQTIAMMVAGAAIALLLHGTLGLTMKGNKFSIDESFPETTSWLVALIHYPIHYAGQIFIKLLKMIIVPLVTTSIAVGVASVGNPKNLGRMGIKTLLYYFSTSIFAILVGLGLTNLIQPGSRSAIDQAATPYNSESLTTPDGPGEILLRMVPTNPIESLAEMDMLGIIFFAICFGMALNFVAENRRERVLTLMDDLFQVMLTLTDGIIKLLPIGVLGLIYTAVLRMPWEKFYSVLSYMATVASGLAIHLFITLPILLFVFTRRSPRKHFSNMRNALITAFSTSSSAATLAVTMDCVEENAGVSNKVTSFVIPMGATVNMDGTALYECAGVLFIAQIMGIQLEITQQLIVVITALLASIGAAGIPSAGLVMIFIVLESVGLKGDQVNLIVATMLAVDRPLDMCRTAVNVFSDSVGAVVIGHSEGEIAPGH